MHSFFLNYRPITGNAHAQNYLRTAEEKWNLYKWPIQLVKASSLKGKLIKTLMMIGREINCVRLHVVTVKQSTSQYSLYAQIYASVFLLTDK